jgi:hypothetical protein
MWIRTICVRRPASAVAQERPKRHIMCECAGCAAHWCKSAILSDPRVQSVLSASTTRSATGVGLTRACETLMDTPIYSPKQYLSSTALTTSDSLLSSSVVAAIASLCGSGLIEYEQASFTTPTALVQNITFGTSFLAIFANGLSQAHGTTPNADTQTYSVDLTPLVPITGSQVVYLYLTYFSLGMAPVTIVGPPSGHPNYDPTFQPYTANTYNRDSFSVGAGTTIPAGSLEIARTTLTAGQTGSVVLDQSHVIRASAYQTGYNSGYGYITQPAYTIGVADRGKSLALQTPGQVITLPNPATLPNVPSFTLSFWQGASTGAVTITTAAGVFVAGNFAGKTSAVLNPGDFLSIIADDNNWRVTSQSYQSPSSLTTTGWKRYQDSNSPNGFTIEQWGSATTFNENTISFMMPFPNACFNVVANEANANVNAWGIGEPTVHGVSNVTKTGFTHWTLQWVAARLMSGFPKQTPASTGRWGSSHETAPPFSTSHSPPPVAAPPGKGLSGLTAP